MDETNAFHRIELECSVRVAASAEALYDMVSDVVRMGEWSPECIESRWLTSAPTDVGRQFVGTNRVIDPTGRERRWEMICEVIEAQRGRRFSWTVLTEAWDRHTSVWTFKFDQHEDHTDVVQQFVMTRPPTGLQAVLDERSAADQVATVERRRLRLEAGMQATLDALKSAAERPNVA